MFNPSPRPLAELPVRRLTRGDLVSCADLAEDRGWPREEHRWGLLLSAGAGYGIDDPEDKGLAAVCVLTSYGPRLAAIGTMLVAGRYGRQGVARRLMRHVIDAAEGAPLSLYATAQGKPLYEGLGFDVLGRCDRLSGFFRPTVESFAVTTRSATAEDLHAILRLDAEVFGADRTHVLARLPAFADHLHIAEKGGELVGYAAAWPSTEFHTVGPVVAGNPKTAKALITSLAAVSNRPLRIDIDARHEELTSWLVEHGMTQGSGTALMAYQSPRGLPGDWTRRFAPLTIAMG
ncbi:GNAT family N-acetyltransferase [Streptomyces sp. DT24]|uniref:GNAT family N-acetyltransferase n=1 Tax=unclassified Streptomyces TaxID=2593676 RepID=UPI003CF01756